MFETEITYCPPMALFSFLLVFGLINVCWQARSTKEKGGQTSEHSERVYRDLDMFLKVALALAAGFGAVVISTFPTQPDVGRQLLIGLAYVSLFSTWFIGTLVLSHLGSKIRRWKDIEWPKAVIWLELWACLGMFGFSTFFWYVAHVWK